jgi:AdoMet-dependent heme synthase
MIAANPFDFFFQWHLTERCNLRCLHCYQDGSPAAEMIPEEIDQTIRILVDTIKTWSDLYEITFSPSVSVTGGEPLLHHDLGRILGSLRQNNFDVFLLTNGTLIKEADAAMLADIPVKRVQVSLEGPERVHDVIRGTGSFQSAIRGVSHLLLKDIKVTLNLTLSAMNVDYIEEMALFGVSLGVERIGFSRLVPSGRGLALIDRMLSKDRVREAYARIRSINVPGVEIVTGDPVYRCAGDSVPPENNAVPFGGCAAGVSGITILSDGTLLPCRRLNIPLGNILKDGLRTVWAASPVLTALRNKKKYKGKCGSCIHWAKCRGCRAIAYQYSSAKGRGSYLSDDPQCFIGEYIEKSCL